MEITLSLAQIIEIVVLIVGLVGSYWKVRADISKKTDKTDFDAISKEVTTLKSEKLSKDDFTKAMNGIRGEVSKGMNDISEVYHDLDKKQNEAMFRIRNLEEKNGG